MTSKSMASVWRSLALWLIGHARQVLLLLAVVTVFFTVCLGWIQRGTYIKDFHRYKSRELIDTIEEKFNMGRGGVIIFEAQNGLSLFEPRLLHEQFKILQTIRDKYQLSNQTLIEGIDAGLRRVKQKTLLETHDYTPIADALLGLSGSNTIKDLERVSRHYLSHPQAIDFYEKFRVVASAYAAPALAGGREKREYSIPYVKAIKTFIQLDVGYSKQEKRQVFAEIRKLLDEMTHPDLKSYLYSSELLSYDVDRKANQNIIWMVLLLSLVDVLLLWAVFRSPRELYISAIVLVTACIWTFGAMALIGIEISFLHLIVLPILLGTGVDDLVVFGRRLAEERAAGHDLQAALQNTYEATGTGILLTTFTTFMAFLCGALISNMPAVAAFFLAVCIAMTSVFILTLLAEASLRWVLLGQDGHATESAPSKESAGLDVALNLLPRWAAYAMAKHPGRLLGYGSLLLLIFVALGLGVEAEFGRRIFLSPDVPTYIADAKETEYFGKSEVGYILFEGQVENPQLLFKMKALEQAMTRYPDIEKIFKQANVESINELFAKLKVRVDDSSQLGVLFDKVLRDTRTANYVLDENFGEVGEHLIYKAGDHYQALVMKFHIKSSDSRVVQDVYDGLWREISRIELDKLPGIKIRVGGGQMATHLEQTYYMTDMAQSFLISLALNFLVLLIFWRRWQTALLAVIPLLFATGMSLGIMVLCGIKLNPLNTTLGMVVVGLGVDYPIHIMERFDEEYKLSANKLEAMQRVLGSMGGHIFGASLTTIVGFATALLFAMPVTQSFGALVGLAVFLAYFATIFFLPVLLVRWQRI